jgi:hypothetical protein
MFSPDLEPSVRTGDLQNMDVTNDSLLYSLADSPGSTDRTKDDFKSAMRRMKLESVFDIARMSKPQFTLELARYTDADAEQVYDNALNYAQQISRLYQEHQVSPGEIKRRVPRSLDSDSTLESATYQTLFNENWEQFCNDGDIAAIDSPVAYLRALYLFAQQLEKSSPSDKKITLETRRPDLKDMVLDQQSAFASRPMLNIVNDTLRSNIEAYLTNGKTVHETLSSEQYPFTLPYDLHHHQCLLGLGTDKPALGALNYRASLKLPFSKHGADYGRVKNPRAEAQRLLSGLSPAQQKLLLDKIASETDSNALLKSYGIEDLKHLHELEFFKGRAGLTTDALEQVLARGKHASRASPNSPAVTDPAYGAVYINGPGSKSVLKITEETSGARKIANTSNERFDRLQRMIRLQHWTGIPIAELDTLIINALRSEGSTAMQLNTNTLRTLGVYRYLNQRYGIAPEEFASLLHDMPTSACGDRVPFFDQVFNRTRLLGSPLVKKQSTELVITDHETFSYLSAGLGLPIMQDSLLLLAQQTEKHLLSLKHDLPTVSSLYRQARVARMFGLSPLECTELAGHLGGEEFCKRLVTGKLNPPESSEPDILDVLMAMDWAVEWLKQNNPDAKQLFRLFDQPTNDLPLNETLEKRLETFRTTADPSADQQLRLIEDLLHDVADLSAEYIPGLMKLAGTSTTSVFSDIKTLTSGKIPQSLAKVLGAVQICQRLHLSSGTLQMLVDNPTWLAETSPADLTPQSLYLLERFSHCARHQAQSEERLLHFLSYANQVTPKPVQKDANGLLARLLNWTIDEVSSITAVLPLKHARAMEDVDWVMRCQACCEDTGLSANILLKAIELITDSPTSDWKTVGEALIAARH